MIDHGGYDDPGSGSEWRPGHRRWHVQARRGAGRRSPAILGELCDSVLASLGAGTRDDVALLLARTTAGGP